jgi:hypothetical protein
LQASDAEEGLVRLKKAWSKVTLEPAIFLFGCMFGILYGVQVQTNLQLWKICHIELGYNDTLGRDSPIFKNYS